MSRGTMSTISRSREAKEDENLEKPLASLFRRTLVTPREHSGGGQTQF